MVTKRAILEALSTLIKQRPGLKFGNYGKLKSYRAELRQIARDKREAETLLTAVALRDSITAKDLLAAFSAYSGRLSISEDKGRAKLEYCTGQYWPTEYRKAVCAVLASALWERKRADCNSDTDTREHASLGDEIRSSFRREFGRSIAQRWF